MHRTRPGLALLAALVIPIAARAEPPVDPYSTWTIQGENDSITSSSDKYYTNGLRIGWTSPTGQLPDFLSDVGRRVWGDGRQRIAIDLSQSIFTPRFTQLSNPLRSDRPYAGVLTANLSLIQDTDNSRSVLGLGLGIVGPGAGGRDVQNGFHHLIGDTPAKGWNYQLHNEPIVQLLSERTWRLPIASLWGLEFDALPTLAASAGTARVYALAGGRVRIGQGLDSDFGPARVRPGLSGSDAYVATRPLAWYLFAGIDGQAVAYDVTLDGNYSRSSRSVTRNPLVGEFEIGAGLIAYGVRLTYAHVFQTQEFKNQRDGLFHFDSIALSVKF